MPSIVIVKSHGEITGVYLPPSLIGTLEIETLDYDHDLSEYDEEIEAQIDNQTLIKIN